MRLVGMLEVWLLVVWSQCKLVPVITMQIDHEKYVDAKLRQTPSTECATHHGSPLLKTPCSYALVVTQVESVSTSARKDAF
jgi:hypothetical protein